MKMFNATSRGGAAVGDMLEGDRDGVLEGRWRTPWWSQRLVSVDPGGGEGAAASARGCGGGTRGRGGRRRGHVAVGARTAPLPSGVGGSRGREREERNEIGFGV